MKLDIVDLTVERAEAPVSTGTVTGQAGGQILGSADTVAVANVLEALRSDLAAQITDDDKSSLHLEEVSVKLTLTAEGRVAFVAKGSVEACIEVRFKRR